MTFPVVMYGPRGTPRVLAPLHLSPFSPPHHDRRVDSPACSGDDGIPVELFQILKDDAVKCCTQYASKFGKLSSGHRTGKAQFPFQSHRKAMPKNAQTTASNNIACCREILL